MRRHALTLPGFLGCVLRFPLITWAVQFLIHYQASSTQSEPTAVVVVDMCAHP